MDLKLQFSEVPPHTFFVLFYFLWEAMGVKELILLDQVGLKLRSACLPLMSAKLKHWAITHRLARPVLAIINFPFYLQISLHHMSGQEQKIPQDLN